MGGRHGTSRSSRSRPRVPSSQDSGRRYVSGRGRIARRVIVHRARLDPVLRPHVGCGRHLLIGGLRSGPLHLGWAHTRHGTLRRPVIEPIATGAAAFGIFYGAARFARHVPILNQAIASVLEYAHRGWRPLILATTLANGVGEEVFFRGAVYAAAGIKHPVPKSTAVYTLAATATRNPALVLVLASRLMGALFARQRRTSGGIQASILIHLTWSTLMLRYLPPLFPDITIAATRSGI